MGVLAGDAGIASDGIGMDLDQARRLEDATTLVDVLEDRGDLVLGQVGAVQRGSLAFGEPVMTGAAIEQAILVEFAESAGDGEVSGAAATEVGAARIEATELSEIILGSGCRLQGEARTGLEKLL